MVYEARWIDPSDGRAFPGTLRLFLPLDDSIESFVAAHDFESRFLVLTLYLEDKEHAILRCGRHGDDEKYEWDSSVAMELAVRIQWMSVDLAPRPSSESVAVEVPGPLPWQADVIAGIASAQQQQLAAIQAVQRQLRSIRTILFALGIGALMFVAVRNI